MSQLWDALAVGTTKFGQVYTKINDMLNSLRCNFSGTSFPLGAVAGQTCWRTDRKLKYLFTDDALLGESGWVEIPIASGGIGLEIVNARGTKPSLDQRLDMALNEDGTLKAPLTVTPGQWIKPFQKYLNYDAQTGNFTIGRTLTGGTSGATAVISSDVDNGMTGTLFLLNVVGTFQNNEIITDGIGGSATEDGTVASAFEYVDAATFKVKSENATDIYMATRRLKINLAGSIVYAEVSISSYGAGDTTVIIKNASANLDNTLVDVEHSLFLPVASDTEGGKSALSLNMVIREIIDVSILETGDFDGLPVNIVHALFPWSTPGKLTNPGTLPAGAAFGAAWSPNGEFLAIPHETSPYISIYQRSGTTFTKLANPGTLPPNTATDAAWSPNGEFLAIAHVASPYVTIYQRSGTTFTKLANPGTLPPGMANGAAWSPNGEFLAIAHYVTPFFTIYQRSGTTFTKLANPGTLPPDTASGAAWSPDGKFLAIAHVASPYATIYQRSGTTFTKLANPGTLPPDTATGAAWSPNGEFLAIPHETSPYISIYQRSGTTFTKLADPGTLPAGAAFGAAWSPNGEFLAIAHVASPYVTIYQRSGTTFTKLANPGTLPPDMANGAAWSPNGEFLAIAHATTPFIAIYQTSIDMPATGFMRVIGQKRAGT
jgi:WD40 repeat protein